MNNLKTSSKRLGCINSEKMWNIKKMCEYIWNHNKYERNGTERLKRDGKNIHKVNIRQKKKADM